MAGDEPRVKIIAAARPIADDEVDRSAVIEVGDGVGARAAGGREEDKRHQRG